MTSEAPHNRPRFLDTIKEKVKRPFSRSRSPSIADTTTTKATSNAAISIVSDTSTICPADYHVPSPFVPPTPAPLPRALETSVTRASHVPSTSHAPAAGLGVGGDELWRDAFKTFEAKFPEQYACLQRATYGERSQHSVEQVIKTWRADKSLEEKLHPYKKKSKEYVENIVKVTQTFSPLISSAAALNPYASIAWTGVSAILPALLVPEAENEAALSGLDKICHLIQIYMSYESFLRSVPNAEPRDIETLKDSIKDVYLNILEYEAEFLLFDEKSGWKQAGSSIANKGQWEKRTSKLKELDQKTLRIKESIFQQQQNLCINEQREWQNFQWKEARWQRLKHILDTLHHDSDYLAIKKSKQAKGVRAEGTCQWFLRHPEYLALRQSDESRLLWVTAGPGCGKSTLALYLVDTRAEGLLQTPNTSPIFLYYFFSYEFSTQNNASSCLRALIHQLLIGQTDSYSSGDDVLGTENDIADPFSSKNLEELWSVFTKQLQKELVKQRGVICVIDALDECTEDSRRPLISLLDDIFPGASGSSSGIAANIRLKLILTSRPYDIIEDEFRAIASRMENIRLRGEDESDVIKEEINLVVAARVKQIALERSLSQSVQNRLTKALNDFDNRTYLWLHLITEYFREAFFRKTTNVEALIHEIPPTVEAAYEQILDKAPYSDRARQLLSISLAVKEPLTVDQTFTALGATQENVREYEDLAPGIEGNLNNVLTSICGLLLMVVDDKVIFLHKTVRDFLMDPGDDNSSNEKKQEAKRKGFKWMHSFDEGGCAAVSGTAYTRLLLMRQYDRSEKLRDDKLMPVAQKDWASHLRLGAEHVHVSFWHDVMVGIRSETLESDPGVTMLQPVDIWTVYGFIPPLKMFLLEYAKTQRQAYDVYRLLNYACHKMHKHVVHFLLGHRMQVPKQAVQEIHASIRKWSDLGKLVNPALLAYDTDKEGQGFGILKHPDFQAAYKEHGDVLIDKLCQPEADKDTNAFRSEVKTLGAIVWLLEGVPGLRLDGLNGGRVKLATMARQKVSKRAVLGLALGGLAGKQSSENSLATLDLLLDRGASPDAYSTELVARHPDAFEVRSVPVILRALIHSNEVVYKKLLARSKLHHEYRDAEGRNALHIAAVFGEPGSISALLATGRYKINDRDKKGRTVLMNACAFRLWKNFSHILPLTQILIDAGADVNLQDVDGNTALHHALGRRTWAPDLIYLILEALLAVESIRPTLRNKAGLTPLDMAQDAAGDNDWKDFEKSNTALITLLEKIATQHNGETGLT